jgi:photosystem II stability/assembly factor-like uncharacterized protein
MEFVDLRHGWMLGRDPCAFPLREDCASVLLSTTDGGATWTEVSRATKPLEAVSFADTADGWALATQACNKCVADFLRTSDGGATWQTETLPSAGYGYYPHPLFRFGQYGIIARRSDILVSEDDGLTWSPRSNGCVQAFLYTMWFNDPLHGWTVCGDGRAGEARSPRNLSIRPRTGV